MRHLSSLASLLLLSVPCWSQSLKLLPGDGEAGEAFGQGVSASGGVVLVGAPQDLHVPSGRGAIYLFDPISGGELAKLLADDWTVDSIFGWAVAVGGNAVIVGAPYGNGSSQDSGAAYLFDVVTGVQTAKLVGDGGSSSEFGAAVAVNGALAVVGARTEWDSSLNRWGVAYIFDTTTGVRIAKVTSNTTLLGEFGTSVAINGDRIVVGDPGETPGSTYYFTSTGTLLAKLLANDGESLDRFGASVGISDSAIVVGAPHDGDLGPLSGSVYIFNPITGLQTAKLLASDGRTGDLFGSSVAISGMVIAVGAPGNGSGSGSVYVFNATTGAQLHKFSPSDGSTGDSFGTSVSLSGNTLVIGAPGGDDLGVDSGSAYVIDLASPPDNSGSGFCSGDGEGATCPCGANGNSGEGCANTSGMGGARLQGVGHASITNDTFYLDIQGAPGNKPGLIFRGSNQHANGFGAQVGDGLLCTSSQTARSHVQVTSNGSTSFANVNGGPFGAWSYGAGSQVNYQFWYRDPGNTCTGLGFNWTNAWAVTWLP